VTPKALAALHALCFTHPRPWSAAEFAALLPGPGVFLVTEGAGFALGRAIAGEAELLTIAVDPDARRRGLGRKLIARFEAEAQARGANHSFLEVALDNAAARALYHSAGYAEAGRRPGYCTAPDGSRIDALILTRALGR